jgi:hypothetical protein
MPVLDQCGYAVIDAIVPGRADAADLRGTLRWLKEPEVLVGLG